MSLQLQGMIASGAGTGSCGCEGGITNIVSIAFGATVPDAARHWGTFTLASAITYAALPGVGAGGVEAATFLYFKTTASIDVQLVQTGIVQGDPDVTSILHLGAGVTLMQLPAEQPVVSIGFKGNASVEYLVAGIK